MAIWRAALVALVMIWAGVVRGQYRDDIALTFRLMALQEYMKPKIIDGVLYNPAGPIRHQLAIMEHGGDDVLTAYVLFAAGRNGGNTEAAREFFHGMLGSTGDRIGVVVVDRVFTKLLAAAMRKQARQDAQIKAEEERKRRREERLEAIRVAKEERERLRQAKRELRDLQIAMNSRSWEVEVEIGPQIRPAIAAPPQPEVEGVPPKLPPAAGAESAAPTDALAKLPPTADVSHSKEPLADLIVRSSRLMVDGKQGDAMAIMRDAASKYPDDPNPYRILCQGLPELGASRDTLAEALQACLHWQNRETDPAVKARAKTQASLIEQQIR